MFCTVKGETPSLDFQQLYILQNSEIPWTGMGSGNSRGITVDFNRAISDALPNYREYYHVRTEQLIPFDIPIIIE